MKQLFFLLLVALLPWHVQAQAPNAESPADTNVLDTPPADQGEAGGIDATDAARERNSKGETSWLLLGGVALAGLLAGMAIVALGKSKKQPQAAAPQPVPEPEESGSKTKVSAAELKKLKQELKAMETQLAAAQAHNTALERNLEIYRNFDSSYFGEAFRKLVAPMHDALEKGARKEIIEILLRIMIHYTSLTRYKIAKKQPYDEANIHYLLNQKGTTDITTTTEISSATPVDKIPKHIKAVTDLLRELGSQGLDDSILAGYKIKNL